jgi:crotonobetainyl-CoA:carnitine CoA-transferase CaiB-like acyl-CoA transferase
MASVLEGIRVLDLSWGVAGPVAGMLLSDHGADVIKVEPPGGDPFRDTPGYDVWLRGRRSVTIDLSQSAGRDRLLELLDGTDVVLESFAPGTLENWGLGGDVLLSRHPRLIHCSITGYGRHADHRDRPGYEALVAARTGMWHVQRGELGGAVTYMHDEESFLPDLEIPDGMEPGAPREGPIFTYTPWLSMGAAFLASVGINAALLARLRTGRGQRVETSLLQAALSATASKWLRVGDPDAKGFRSWIYDRRAPKGFFLCSDGRWVEQWVPNPQFALTSADGDTLDLRRDVDRVLNDPDRIEPDPENIVVLAHYFPLMKEAFARFPSAEWVEVARRAGVPLQPVRTPEEALADEALRAEEAVVDVSHPAYGSLRQAGILYGLSATPGRVQGPPPRVGEHDRHGWDADPESRAEEPAGEPDGRPPLDGVTVLDLGFAVAGPFGTQVLADLGADVIKVNAWRDPFWHSRHIAYGCNRGKRSIGIDLKTPEGLQVFHRLVARADVVHSNMRRDALRRLACDEASLRQINPDIIYCHTRGFDRGPRSDSPGNDQTGCSLAGVTWEDGGGWNGGKPFWSMTSLGDTGNGFLSAIGVIQALYHRALTGQAQSVDTSILNAGLLVASMAAVTPAGAPLPRPRLDGMQLGLSPFYRLYEAIDGWVCLAAVTPGHREALTAATGIVAVEFADLEPWFAHRSAAEAWQLLDQAGVPCEVCDGEFGKHIYEDPEMHANRLVVVQEHPRLGRFEHFGQTITFSGTPERIQGPPPICGQHTREIMQEHGFESTEIDKLIEAKAIFEERWVD